jgi:hypothetical protein
MKDENVHVKFVDAFLNLLNRVINLPVSSWNFFFAKIFPPQQLQLLCLHTMFVENALQEAAQR